MQIICEIGQNYCGSIQLAETLIDLACTNGAWAAKFQLFDGLKMYGGHTEIEMTRAQAEHLFAYGQNKGIEIFFSVFDEERVKWCEEMGVKRYKIAARSSQNKELIEAVRKTGKPAIQSMSPAVSHYYIPKAQYLYCSSVYPTSRIPPLDALDFNWWAGYSDHCIGLDAAKVAIDNGAKIIEKHFAIDHQTGIDAPWSMTPEELAELVKYG